MLVMVVWLLSLVVLVFGILGIMSKIFGSHKSTALKALNDKYLKGEISKEEYEQAKRVLENL
ncbi:SHOCT domain-containing protein [Hydrogenobaculum acidophilum]